MPDMIDLVPGILPTREVLYTTPQEARALNLNYLGYLIGLAFKKVLQVLLKPAPPPMPEVMIFAGLAQLVAEYKQTLREQTPRKRAPRRRTRGTGARFAILQKSPIKPTSAVSSA